MSAKFTVRLASEIANHPLPSKILLNQDLLEPVDHVLLKLLAFVLFQRDRLQIEPRLHDENIPFVPDLVQLDYQLKPALWVECGDTEVTKLDKLAVKAPWAELWLVLRSREALETYKREMERLGLRRDRYEMLAFEATMFDEMLALLASRNELTLFRFNMNEGELQLDFNGIWFDAEIVRATF
ncbi:hypothetical protein GC207_11475 [bacterium]|nr:hypothetical protein [bacterium]